MADGTKLYELRETLAAARVSLAGYRQQVAAVVGKLDAAEANLVEWEKKVEMYISIIEEIPDVMRSKTTV